MQQLGWSLSMPPQKFLLAKRCFLWPNDKLPHAWIHVSINFCPLCFSYTRRCVACETYHNLYVTCQCTVCMHGPCMDVWQAMTLIGTIKQAMSEGAALIEYYYGIGYTSFIYWDWSVRKKTSLTVLNCTTVLQYQQLSWDKWSVDDLSATQCNNRAEYTDYITTTTANHK